MQGACKILPLLDYAGSIICITVTKAQILFAHLQAAYYRFSAAQPAVTKYWRIEHAHLAAAF